jgi:hypothetical protein
MRVKCPAHPPRCKPGLALAGTGLSRSPGCVCVALMNRNSTFQRATRFTRAWCRVNIHRSTSRLSVEQHYDGYALKIADGGRLAVFDDAKLPAGIKRAFAQTCTRSGVHMEDGG